jgi:hypothetical protein
MRKAMFENRLCIASPSAKFMSKPASFASLIEFGGSARGGKGIVRVEPECESVLADLESY